MLMGLRDLEGFAVLGPDGSLGVIEDAYFEDKSWRVCLLALTLPSGKSASLRLLPTAEIHERDDDERTITTGFTEADLKREIIASRGEGRYHSANRLIGSTLETAGGVLGTVVDFVLADDSWVLDSLALMQSGPDGSKRPKLINIKRIKAIGPGATIVIDELEPTAFDTPGTGWPGRRKEAEYGFERWAERHVEERPT